MKPLLLVYIEGVCEDLFSSIGASQELINGAQGARLRERGNSVEAAARRLGKRGS